MCRTGGRRCPGSGGRGRSGGSPASSAGGQGASRRLDGKPETDADRRFFDLRTSGYTGPIDQDGYRAHLEGTGNAARIVRD